MIPAWSFGFGRLARNLLASSYLPIYELDLGNVTDPRGRIRPFTNSTGFSSDPKHLRSGMPPPSLSLSGWRLAHATVKADCLARMPFHLISTVGTQLQMNSALDWREQPLRLFCGAARGLSDFVGTSLAGRIGQGVALLFMEERKYAFAAHYTRVTGMSGPDFIFQDAFRSFALVEAKGSFLKPNTQENIKGELAEAIKQVGSAGRFPRAKDLAIATYLRESADSHIEPSLIAFVDPTHEPLDELPDPDLVRRHNYAAWLDLMGFHESASDLRLRRRRVVERRVQIPTLRLNGRTFAVVEVTISPSQVAFRLPPHPQFWIFEEGLHAIVFGLDLERLRVIESTLTSPTTSALANISLLEGQTLTGEDHEIDGFRGSILADGSLLGEVGARRLWDGTPEMVGL